jgi:hypothetical protein
MGLPTTLEGRTDSMLARAKGHAAKGLFERLCGLETWKHWTFGKGDVGGFCQVRYDIRMIDRVYVLDCYASSVMGICFYTVLLPASPPA